VRIAMLGCAVVTGLGIVRAHRARTGAAAVTAS
jgi:Zn-dependent alcohol dehydrogenase